MAFQKQKEMLLFVLCLIKNIPQKSSNKQHIKVGIQRQSWKISWLFMSTECLLRRGQLDEPAALATSEWFTNGCLSFEEAPAINW